MKTFYFTFGANHLDHENNSLGRCYTFIQAFDENQARNIMFACRELKWSMCYVEEQFIDCIQKYNLDYLSLGETMLPISNV